LLTAPVLVLLVVSRKEDTGHRSVWWRANAARGWTSETDM